MVHKEGDAVAGRSSADELLALHLASGREVADAARLAHLAERTAYRRLTDPTFRARVAELRAEMVTRAVAVLSKTMVAAALKLRRLMGSPDPKVALRASVAILDLGTRLREAQRRALTPGPPDGTPGKRLDLSRLTDDEFAQYERLVTVAAVEPDGGPGGAVPPVPR